LNTTFDAGRKQADGGAVQGRPGRSRRCSKGTRTWIPAAGSTARSPRSIRMSVKRIAIILLAVMPLYSASASGPASAPEGSSPQAPDVLLIMIDDLNDWVGVLGGNGQARTPNIDELASQGMLFANAHTVSPACLPSRTA